MCKFKVTSKANQRGFVELFLNGVKVTGQLTDIDCDTEDAIISDINYYLKNIIKLESLTKVTIKIDNQSEIYVDIWVNGEWADGKIIYVDEF